MKRSHISLKTKLASALLTLGDYQVDPATGRTRWMRFIPYLDAQLMTADQIISLFAFDHYPQRKADGGPDEPWNLEPRMIRAHREKTAKVDVPEMAKSKRILRKQEAHLERMGMDMVSGAIVEPRPHKRSIPSRPWAMEAVKWPAAKRHILSRPFPNKKRPFVNKAWK